MRKTGETECLMKALDALESHFYVISPDFEIIAANAFTKNSVGDDLVGNKCFEIFCRESAPCAGCSLQAVLSKGGVFPKPGVRLAGGGGDLPCGQVFPIYDRDKIQALVCTDIGAQRLVDLADRLKLANAFLKNLIQSSPDAVIAADPERKILLFNDAAREMLGYSSQETLANLSITDFLPDNKMDDLVTRLRSDHYGGKGKLTAYHLIILDKSGNKIPIRLDATIVYDGEKELATIGYFRDLRDDIRVRQAAQKEKGTVADPAKTHSLESIATSVAQRLKIYNQQFSDTAIRVGLIDKSQLNRAREQQKQLQEKTKIAVPFGKVLVQLEYITEQQRTAIIAMQALAAESKNNSGGETLGDTARQLAREQDLYNQRFGDLAVKLGFISEDQLGKSLKMQRQVQEKIEINVPLGRVLVQLDYITEEQRAAVLAVQALSEGAEKTDHGQAKSSPGEVPDAEGVLYGRQGVDEPEADGVAAGEAAIGAEETGIDADGTDPEVDGDEKGPEKAGPGTGESGPPTDSDSEIMEPGPDTGEVEGDSGQKIIREHFAVDISEDRLTAYLVPKTRERAPLTFDDLRELIEAEGIRYGLVAEEETKAFLNDDTVKTESLILAKGKPPEEGKDPEIVFDFETDPLKAGKVQEDGTIDWKDRGEIPQVSEGDLLAKIIPGTYGAAGMDVLGNEIPARPIAKITLIAGKGVKTSEGGSRFVASSKGTPILMENGTLTISPVLQIPGDVGIETGHIEFDGHIEVAGVIESGYQVRGESLRAQSITNAEIYISGDIVVPGGIFDSTIKCQGTLKAVHVHKSDMDVGGDLVVEKEIIDSKAEVHGVCKMEYGTIVSSEIAARAGIIAKNVGTAMSKPSHLDIGVDHKLRREISGLKKMFSKAGHTLKKLAPQAESLKAESDQVNGQLGEVAQKQDQNMVRLRQLQEKFKDRENLGESVKTEYEQAIAGLEARRHELDAEVETLMQKDGEIEVALAEFEELETELIAEQAELEGRIEALCQRRESEKGKPVLKVFGDLFHGTKITGPKSKITIEDDCSRVNVFETDKADDGQFARWHMRIGPLR